MTYRIRAVDGSDPEVSYVLATLHKQTFGDDAELVSFNEGHWWIAYSGKEPAAFAGMVPSYTTAKGGYLIRSGVLPYHRGHGLQVRLLRARERQARKNGWTVLISDTTDNIHSSNSLMRAGFRLYEPERPWFLDRTLYWRKELH